MYINILVTTPSMEASKKIAFSLLESRLAACVNINPNIRSFYWWEDKIQESDEYQLTIKTKLGLYNEVEEMVLGLHPYSVPEIIAAPIITGNKHYLDWIASETKYTEDDSNVRGISF